MKGIRRAYLSLQRFLYGLLQLKFFLLHIQNFLQQTTLLPAGVLQSSFSVGPQQLVHYHHSSLQQTPSDIPVDVDGSPTTRPREAAVDATGADGAASGAAATTQRICRQPPQQQQSLRQEGTPTTTAAAAGEAGAVATAVAGAGMSSSHPFS